MVTEQPVAVICSVTDKVPVPAPFQVTVTLLVPVPAVIVPPAIDHEYVLPTTLAVVYTTPVVLAHTVLSPEIDGVGTGLLVRITSSKLEHKPLVIVHRSVALLLTGTPSTLEFGAVGLAIVAVPANTLHTPVPVTGVLPANVNVPLLHWLISLPAAATVAGALLVRMTSSVLGVQVPLEIVQRKVALPPAGTPVTPDVGDDGVVAEPAPAIRDHAPVPVAGVFAAIVNVAVLHLF